MENYLTYEEVLGRYNYIENVMWEEHHGLRDDYKPYTDDDLEKIREILWLLANNFKIKDHTHGYLLEDSFIIAGKKKKWRKDKKSTWYWYSNIELLISDLF